MSRNPFGRGICIVNSRGKLMLGGKTVIDRNNATTAFIGESAAKAVMCVKITENLCAAMKINYPGGRRIAGSYRYVESRGDRSSRSWQAAMLDRTNWFFPFKHLIE